MKNQIFFYALVLICVLFYAPLSNAKYQQEVFQGEMTLLRYVPGSPEDAVNVNIVIHPDYLLFENPSGSVMSLMGNHHAEAVIIRHNTQALVFLTSQNKALVMGKQELQQMIRMMENIGASHGKQAPSTPQFRFNETDEEQEIEGIQTRKWIVEQDQASGQWHLWVTKNIVIPWGMLSEEWLLQYSFFSGLPTDQWFNDSMIPLKGEKVIDGTVVDAFKIHTIKPGPVDPKRFEIPDHYQQITFQQLLFGQMRNNR